LAKVQNSSQCAFRDTKPITEDQSRGHGAGKVLILSDQEPRSFVN
jgi:hypothetical protein